MQIPFYTDCEISEFLVKNDEIFPPSPEKCPFKDCSMPVKLEKHGYYKRFFIGVNEIFTPTALVAIHTISGGFLRTINNIALASLMYATARKMSNVDEEAVYQANIEMGF